VRTVETCPHAGRTFPCDNNEVPQRPCAALAARLGFGVSVQLPDCAECCQHETPDNPIVCGLEVFHLRNRLRCGDEPSFRFSKKMTVDEALRRLRVHANAGRVDDVELLRCLLFSRARDWLSAKRCAELAEAHGVPVTRENFTAVADRNPPLRGLILSILPALDAERSGKSV